MTAAAVYDIAYGYNEVANLGEQEGLPKLKLTNDMITLVNEMVEAGSTVLNEPAEMFWGDLKARVKDPFGFIWDIAQKL